MIFFQFDPLPFPRMVVFKIVFHTMWVWFTWCLILLFFFCCCFFFSLRHSIFNMILATCTIKIFVKNMRMITIYLILTRCAFNSCIFSFSYHFSGFPWCICTWGGKCARQLLSAEWKITLWEQTDFYKVVLLLCTARFSVHNLLYVMLSRLIFFFFSPQRKINCKEGWEFVFILAW